MKKIFKPLILLSILLLVFACRDAGKTEATLHPEWSYNAVIYELNTRQFTPEGTFEAATGHLDRLKELGVDILWLMPIQPIGEEERKGELGSYYSIADYTAVNPEFGTTEDFRAFVQAAHDRDMRVILDWVANHTSRDAVWLKAGHTDWYVLAEDSRPVAPFDWSDVAELNYDNREMREAMIAAMQYWLRELQLDGFRCDVADEVPLDFWQEAVPRLKEVNPGLFMLAEAETPALHDAGFDMTYGWDMHHILNGVAKGEKTVVDVRERCRKDQTEFPYGAFRMQFTSNHDENSWNGTEFERMGDAVQTLAALTYVIPGMPLIYNGQEAGFDRRLEFFVKDRIDWPGDRSFTAFYKKLNDLRHNSPALASGERGAEPVGLRNDAPEQVYSFSRSKERNTVIAVFNLKNEPVEVILDTKGLEGRYTDAMSGTAVSLEAETKLSLAPWQYHIYVR